MEIKVEVFFIMHLVYTFRMQKNKKEYSTAFVIGWINFQTHDVKKTKAKIACRSSFQNKKAGLFTE